MLLLNREEQLIATIKDPISAYHREGINDENILELTIESPSSNVDSPNMVLNSYGRRRLSDLLPTESDKDLYSDTPTGGDFEVVGGYGRNLVKGTDFDGDTFRYEHNNKAGEGGLILSRVGFTGTLTKPNRYTISMNIRGESEQNIVIYRISPDGNNPIDIVKKRELTEDFQRVYLTFLPHQEELTDLFIFTAYRTTVYNAWFEIEPESLKLEYGSTPTPWSPAPEDLDTLGGVRYNLTAPLTKNQYYTISAKGDFTNEDFVGVWLGNDKFIGYLIDGKMTFKANEDYEDQYLICKALNDSIHISQIQLEEGEHPTPYIKSKQDLLTDLSKQSIEKGYRIVYKDIYNKWHEFIVQSFEERHEDGEVVYDIIAEDSLYETLGDYVVDKRPRDKIAAAALADALGPTRFEVGNVDDLGINSTNFYHISAKESIHKVIETWEGELATRVEVMGNRIVNRYVDIYKKRGHDLGKRFVYTKDIETITRKVHNDDVITALYGYGKGEYIEETGGYGRRITFEEINDGKAYVENDDARQIWGRMDPSGVKQHVFHKVEFDDCEDPEELLEMTIEKLKELSDIKITYTAKVLDLKALGFDHEGVELGDTVLVIDKSFVPELRVKARVIEMVRDLIYPHTDTTITLGNFLPSITDSLLDTEEYISNFRSKESVWDRSNIIGQNGSIDAKYLEGVIDELNKKLNSQGGYVYMEDGGGIITYNKPLDQNPTEAIQIIGGAFRIANSKLPNGEWDWRTFGTGSGFTADMIIAGILKGGKVKLDLNNGTLLVGNSTSDYLLYFDGTSLKMNLSGKNLEEYFEDIDDRIDNIELTPGPKGEDGKSPYSVQLITTNGSVFKNGIINTIIMARVYYGDEDITDTIDSNRFRWSRVSDDPGADNIWNSEHFGGKRTIQVTTEDVYRKALFTCTILKE